MHEPIIQVEMPDGSLHSAWVARLKTPHGAATQIDCYNNLAVVRRRPWDSVPERKAHANFEDEITLVGSTQGPPQIMINDWITKKSHLVMFGHVEEIVIGHRLEIPREIPFGRQGETSGGIQFYVVADADCIVSGRTILPESYAQIRARLG